MLSEAAKAGEAPGGGSRERGRGQRESRIPESNLRVFKSLFCEFPRTLTFFKQIERHIYKFLKICIERLVGFMLFSDVNFELCNLS